MMWNPTRYYLELCLPGPTHIGATADIPAEPSTTHIPGGGYRCECDCIGPTPVCWNCGRNLT